MTEDKTQNVPGREYDPKALAELVLKAIIETRSELSKRMDRIIAIADDPRPHLRHAEDCIQGPASD